MMGTELPAVMYEADCPAVAGNRKAEMAIVHLALTIDELFDQLHPRIEPRDFMYDDCRFIFGEVVAMKEAGQPLSDKAAQSSWFRRPEVCQRMKDAKLDWFEKGRPLAWETILEIVIGGEFATAAHLDWYVEELRRWRTVRGLRLLAWDLSRAVDLKGPLEVLAWLEEKVSQIKDVAKPLLGATT